MMYDYGSTVRYGTGGGVYIVNVPPSCTCSGTICWCRNDRDTATPTGTSYNIYCFPFTATAFTGSPAAEELLAYWKRVAKAWRWFDIFRLKLEPRQRTFAVNSASTSRRILQHVSAVARRKLKRKRYTQCLLK